MPVHAQDATNKPPENPTTSPVGVSSIDEPVKAHPADRQLVTAGRPLRRPTTARPLSAGDAALVTRITQVLETVDAVDLTTAVHQSMKLKAVRPETVVVPAPSISVTMAVRSLSQKQSGHRFAPYLKSVAWVVTICLVIGVVEAVAPIGAGSQAVSFVPIAAQLAGNPTLDLSTGPWATGSVLKRRFPLQPGWRWLPKGCSPGGCMTIPS